jgi:hypothetical protein
MYGIFLVLVDVGTLRNGNDVRIFTIYKPFVNLLWLKIERRADSLNSHS